MGRPARAGALPGLGSVGTPRNVRGVDTMETTMTNRIRRPKETKTPGAAKAKTAPGRGRRGPKTKKQFAIALLERPKWLFRPAAVAIIPGQLKAPLSPPADMFVLAAVDWLRRRTRLGRAPTTSASLALPVMTATTWS